jgi:SAM-dependent methyltransferase
MKSPLAPDQTCKLVKTFDLTTIARRWKIELGIDWQPSNSTHLSYWQCPVSNLFFYTPNETVGDESLYIQLERFSWYYMPDKWEFRKALELLGENKKVKRILEVGVGKGFFLEKASATGIDIEGVELNSEAAAVARSKGFKVHGVDLSQLATTNLRSWDGICAFQVIEHLSNPREFLEHALTLLRPGGILILSVPNSAVTVYFDPERTNLLDQPPHHMSHWDEHVFHYLEKILPVKINHIAFEPLAKYHVDSFIASWANQAKASFGDPIRRIIMNRFTIPLLRRTLNLGLRYMVRGHTLLVCLRKTE